MKIGENKKTEITASTNEVNALKIEVQVFKGMLEQEVIAIRKRVGGLEREVMIVKGREGAVQEEYGRLVREKAVAGLGL